MRELLPWLRVIVAERRRLIAGALLILLTMLAGVGLLALSGWFIAATAVTGLLLAAGIAAPLNIYVPGGGIRLFAVTRTVARYLERVYNHDTVLRTLATLRIRLFRVLSSRPRAWRDDRKGAEWLTRLTRDLDTMDTLYLRLLAPTALAVLISAAIVAVAAVMLSGLMAAVAGGLLLAALLTATLFLHLNTRRLGGGLVRRQSAHRVNVIDYIEGQEELIAAGVVNLAGARLADDGLEITADQARIEARIGWHRAMSGILVNLTVVGCLWLGLALFEAGAISGPVAVILPLALFGLAEVYGQLPEAFGRLGETTAAAARLNGVTDVPTVTESADVGAEQAALEAGAMLSLRDVSFGYRPGNQVLAPISLDIRRNERLGVVGVSGSGKSTLADLIAGLQLPEYGVVCRPDTESSVAYLQQRTRVFHDTVRYNLVPDGRRLSDERLWSVLSALGLAERIAQLPAQLDSWLGIMARSFPAAKLAELHLRERFLRDAPLVILDEPFTGLDAETRDGVSEQLETWLEGRAVVILAHGPDALPRVDRLLHLPATVEDECAEVEAIQVTRS